MSTSTATTASASASPASDGAPKPLDKKKALEGRK
jgi:hypothetical protein